MNTESIIEQPMPAQFEDESAGGCQAGAGIAIVLVIIVIVFVVTIAKND